MNYYEMVKEFHEAFDIPIADNPTLLSKDRHELRMALIREEWIETLEAWVRSDGIELMDGTCDVVYVLLGYLAELGIGCLLDDEKDFIELEAVDIGSIDTAYYLGDGDEVCYRLLTSAEYMIAFGIQVRPSFPQAFAEVHRSNMAKLWSESDIRGYNLGFKDQQGKYLFKESSKPGLYIATRPDGKVMKPPTWEAPNLKQFL